MPVAARVNQSSPLRVGLLGLGTVGGAVAARLVDDAWRASVAARGLPVPELVAVAVRDPAGPRRSNLPPGVELTRDPRAVVGRDDVDVVIELIGGLHPARQLVEQALARGRAVVTANKALLAEFGPSLEGAARRSGAALRFEAAVGGGIPILAPLARDLAANRIDHVRGIVSGTTNFILSAMATDGRAYGDVLADAQTRGYAEADPRGDVEGIDSSHKLVLLARLAFGTWLEPSAVTRTPASADGDGAPGITGVTVDEMRAAAELGLALKLVAFAGRQGDTIGMSSATSPSDAALAAWVEPCAVWRESLIGATDGALNAIEVVGQPIGRLSMRGAGAGGDTTSSAVLGDLLALARGEGATWAALPEAARASAVTVGRDCPARWFYRSADGGTITERVTLDVLGARLRARGATRVTIYRLLED